MKLIESHDESLESVKKKVGEMFAAATDHVRISTGLSRGLFNEEPVRAALTAALSRVSEVDILLDPDAVMDQRYEWLYSHPKVQIRRSHEDTPHRIIVDMSTVRLEQPHVKGADVRDNLLIKDCDPVAARLLINEFDEDFSQGALVDLPS